MTRFALLVVLVVSLAVAGVAFVKFESGDIESRTQEASTNEPTESMGTDDHGSHPDRSLRKEDPSSMTDPSGGSSSNAAGASTDPTSAHTGHTPDAEDRPEDNPAGPGTTAPATTVMSKQSVARPLVIPATLSYPGGLNDGGGYRFELACIDTEEVTCDLNSSNTPLIAQFDYVGHGMPYLYSEAVDGNHDHAWWVEGDREGYVCAYGFMYDKHPNPFGTLSAARPAELIARATIVRPLGQGYGKVNDAYMSEGVRYYSGALANEGQEISSEDCQSAALDDFDYEGYQPQGEDAIRIGLFRSDGEIGDIRDFRGISPKVPGHFEFISLENDRATLVFILGATNKVSHVFYYDAINSGRIAVEVNGRLLR